MVWAITIWWKLFGCLIHGRYRKNKSCLGGFDIHKQVKPSAKKNSFPPKNTSVPSLELWRANLERLGMAQSRDLRQFLSERGRRTMLWLWRNYSDIIKTISQIFWTCSGDDGLRCTQTTQKEVCFNKHSLRRLRKEYSLHDTITFNHGHLKIRRNYSDIIKTISQIFRTCSGNDFEDDFEDGGKNIAYYMIQLLLIGDT